MWRFKIDPDSSSIPYLTALGDFLGSSLLLLAFMFLRYIGHQYEERTIEDEFEATTLFPFMNATATT
jgi:solute carrier family 41